jgi:hypothetical protein
LVPPLQGARKTFARILIVESENLEMMNPFGPQQEPGLSSYVNLKKRTLQKVQASNVNDQIFQVVQNSFEEALRNENVVLSRPERKLLFAQILKSVLEDMVNKLNNSTKSSS